MDAALRSQDRGVQESGGAVVVLGEGLVEGAAVEEEIELRLPSRASSVVGEAIDDVFEDKAVVDQEARKASATGPGAAGRSPGRGTPAWSGRGRASTKRMALLYSGAWHSL